MNYLGHFFLCKKEHDLMTGVFLGDHVKGRLRGNRPKTIELGIKFHRAVDAFVDSEPNQRSSVDRLDPKYRRFGGIICDVVYDYFLANSWQDYSDVNFDVFCDQAYDAVLTRPDHLDEAARSTILRMQANRSLQKYRSKDYVAGSLNHISGRLRQPNPLAEAFHEFERHEQEMTEDFAKFLPEVVNFSEQWLKENR